METANTAVRRRVARGAVAWLITFGLVRTVVLHPENCGTVTIERLDVAISETVAWADRTVGDDGKAIYRYDADTDTDTGAYEMVRHSGLVMGLYQAARFGETAAQPVAERTDAYVRERLVDYGDWTAVSPDRLNANYDIGATALYLNGLLYRRELTGSTEDDQLLIRLGRFLLANVEEAGSVPAGWDPVTEASVPEVYSPFFTGEAWWALSRLQTVLPGEWREPALRVAHYVATTRDDAENRFPDVPDHWAAYAMAEMARWPGDDVITEELITYANHLAALESMQIRYESQRTGSAFSRLTRGQIALGAGLGSLGEGLLSLRDIPALADDAALRERSECAVGLMLHRQVTPEEALKYPNPPFAQGAWIREGITQIDDQQHSLSSLLLLREFERTS